jgi:hypothetical protein
MQKIALDLPQIKSQWKVATVTTIAVVNLLDAAH